MEKSGVIEAQHYITCLWPGLSELWWRGRLSALPVAIVFAFALNLLLVMRFLYPEWLSGILISMACWIGVGAWAFYVMRSVKSLPELLRPREVSEKPDRFSEAQLAYLNADWKTAERDLLGVLAIEPRDPPALLLLSGVYRHTDRADSAKLVMSELGKLEIGEQWSVEIEAEMRRIDRSLEDQNDEPFAEESGSKAKEKTTKNTADLTAA